MIIGSAFIVGSINYSHNFEKERHTLMRNIPETKLEKMYYMTPKGEVREAGPNDIVPL